jgi:hypothetical protein
VTLGQKLINYYTLGSLVRRDAQQNSLRVWFWVSMIVLAIPAFASIIGIPFYFIAVYVASKYMALPMNDTIGQ